MWTSWGMAWKERKRFNEREGERERERERGHFCHILLMYAWKLNKGRECRKAASTDPKLDINGTDRTVFFFRVAPENQCARRTRNREINHCTLVTTVKLCIKAAAFVQFFNFLVRPLFKDGLYAMFWACKTRESSLAQSYMYSESETWLCECHKIVSKCKQTFWQAKAVEGSCTWTISGHHFQAAACIWVRLMCNLSLENVRLVFKCGF